MEEDREHCPSRAPGDAWWLMRLEEMDLHIITVTLQINPYTEAINTYDCILIERQHATLRYNCHRNEFGRNDKHHKKHTDHELTAF